MAMPRNSYKRLIYLIIILLAIAGAVFRNYRPNSGDLPATFDRHAHTLILTRHARCRMDCRHISREEIREILLTGKVNYAKSEPDGKPDPKYAIEGHTNDGQEVRIIFASSPKGMVVVTVIDLGREWTCDCP